MSTQDTQETQDALNSLHRLGYASVELVVTSGPQKGARFPLQAGENTIGRVPGAQALLEENEISRRHARITIQQEIQVEDLGSAVGTLLNGRLLMGRDFLFDNDELRVGPYTLRIEIKRQESRRGILVALACLGVALVLFALAMLFPESMSVGAARAQSATDAGDADRAANRWRSWETLVLPDKDALARESVPLTAEAARVQYDFATRLYQDRFGDPGNPYQALLYYKRALAIIEHLPADSARPTVANRSLERIAKLQEMIAQECQKRVFAFQRAQELQWWQECLRILGELRQVCPWEQGRYNRWADEQTRLLKRMLQP